MRTVLVSIFCILAVAAGVAILICVQGAMPAQMARKPAKLSGDISFDALFSGITPEGMGRRHRRIVQPASRLAGSEGDVAASRFVEEELRRLMGDDNVIVQRYPVTIPVTRECTITHADGAEVPGVSLLPFWPNMVRTCTTPPDGIVGTVVDAGSGAMEDLDGKRIRGNIALVTLKRGMGWVDAVKLGATAVLFRPGTDSAAYLKKILRFPGNIPRFLASGPVDALVGKPVRIRARVDWEIRQARNVFGVLRPSQEATEALVLLAHTDSWSVVPDKAPGSYEACAAASLLEIARALAAQRKAFGRTIIFGALSGRSLVSEGVRRLNDALGNRESLPANHARLQGRFRTAEADSAACQAALTAYESADYWTLDKGAESDLWRRYGPAAQKAFAAAIHGLIDDYIRVADEKFAAAKLAWVQEKRPEEGPIFDAQLSASHRLRRARSAAGAVPVAFKEFFEDVKKVSGAEQRTAEALRTALRHANAEKQYQQDSVRVAELFLPHERVYHFLLAPSTSGSSLGYAGDRSLCIDMERMRDAVVAAYLRWRKLPGDNPATYPNYITNAAGDNRLNVTPSVKGSSHGPDLGLATLRQAAHAAFTFRGLHAPDGFHTPLDTSVNLKDLAEQTRLLAAMAAQIGSGSDALGVPGKDAAGIVSWFSDYGGHVMASGGSNSILPNRPVPNAVVVLKGVYGAPFYIQKTPTGRFRFPAIEAGGADALTCDAYTLDERTGDVTGARDLGPDGQRYPVFRGKRGGAQGLFADPETRVTVLLTRAAPTDIFGLTGPDGEDLTVDILDARFRTPPNEFSLTEYWGQGVTLFVRPGERFYVVLRDCPQRHFDRKGTVTRGFLLGHSTAEEAERAGQGFWGPGYLAGRDSRIVFQEVDLALSMGLANRERLESQIAQGLADPVTLQLSNKADKLRGKAMADMARQGHSDAYRNLTSSWGVSARAYPGVRTAVADAVNGILLYMFLLAPFSVFAERLLLGASDIRMRILGVFGIFLAVFMLIRFTHPAYRLVASPMIVLVGFVIFMLCVLILGFVSGKFAERIAELRRSGGGATEADSDVSRSSAAGAAFNLGINSMRKRKVRTAYTVATLALISFSLVCFTSPQPELLEQKTVQGSAPFNGVLLREPGSIAAAKAQYGDKAKVVARRARHWPSDSSQLGISHTPSGGAVRQTHLSGLVYVEPEEGLLTGIDKTVLPGGRWFTQEDHRACYISDITAGELGITPDLVTKKKYYVTLFGRQFRVLGVFDNARLDRLRDIDGESFLPELSSLLDAEARQKERTRRLVGRPGAKESVINYLPASVVALLPLKESDSPEYTSAVILYEKVPYGEMREGIAGIMDRRPVFFSFALDGLSFFGGKLRAVGLEGVVDIVVPLLLASFIVFNTMLGSVYERQKEISVYSAVGLSPRHVFYLFLAESLVYAVIGVVAGYLLGLGLQWFSHTAGDLLGLTINYSSRSAIYVCVTLMLAVVASTFFPARRAARIASPSERVSWSIPPESSPGRLAFDLPFTYIGRDVVAVVPFLLAWFDARGEDSSGEFSATPPEVEVQWRDGQPTFSVVATVWLRPYDLGVSQRVAVSASPSDEPGIFVANVRIRLLSGDLTSWRRTNARFVAILRGHLLSWRALSPQSKHSLFDRGSQLLLPEPQA